MSATATKTKKSKRKVATKIQIETFVCCECGSTKTEKPLVDTSNYKWCWDCISCGADSAIRYVTENV